MSEPRPGDGIGIVFASFLSKAVVIGVCLLISLVSMGPLSQKYSSVSTYEHEIEVLDTQKMHALELSAASATASTFISMIPDDTGTPLSNQMATVSKDLALVTGAVLLEKYLLTILGYAFFSWLVPICSIIFALGFVLGDRNLLKIPLVVGAIKVLIVGFIIWRAIPMSVFVIDRINETYDLTITNAIEAAQNLSTAAGSEEEADNDEDKGFFSAASETIDSLKRMTVGKAQELIAWAKVALTAVLEGFAVLVITSCVIPLFVPIALLWLVKAFFQPTGVSAPALPAPKTDFEVLSNGLIAPWSKRTAKQD